MRGKPREGSPLWGFKLFPNLKKPEPAGVGLAQPGPASLPHPQPGHGSSLLQGDTPRQRAEKAQDTELAAYLENRQHYQMVQREDQETAV